MFRIGGVLIFFMKHFFELETVTSEIDDQANWEIVSDEVIFGLSQMCIFQIYLRFQFEDSDLFHNKISPSGTSWIPS